MGLIRTYDIRCDSCEELLSDMCAAGPFDNEFSAKDAAKSLDWFEYKARGGQRWICDGCFSAANEGATDND